MEVTDISLKNKPKRNNSPLLPQNLRGLLVGRSNSGKSVLLFNLLLKKDWLDYDNLLVYGNSLFQPEYELIKKGFENKLQKEEILDIFQKNPRDLSEAIEKYQGPRVGDITAEFYENCELIFDIRYSRAIPKKSLRKITETSENSDIFLVYATSTLGIGLQVHVINAG